MKSYHHTDELLREKISRFETAPDAGLDKARAWKRLHPRLRRRRPLLRYAAAALLLAAGLPYFWRPGAPPAKAPTAASTAAQLPARPPAWEIAGEQPPAEKPPSAAEARPRQAAAPPRRTTQPAAARGSGNTPVREQGQEARTGAAGLQPLRNQDESGEGAGKERQQQPAEIAIKTAPAPRRLPVLRLHELVGGAGAATAAPREPLSIRLPGGEGQPAVAASRPAGPLIRLPLNAKH